MNGPPYPTLSGCFLSRQGEGADIEISVLYIYEYVYVYFSIYIYIHIYVYIKIYINTYINTYIYIYPPYIYIYIQYGTLITDKHVYG
jgi:hypothetical protein